MGDFLSFFINILGLVFVFILVEIVTAIWTKTEYKRRLGQYPQRNFLNKNLNPDRVAVHLPVIFVCRDYVSKKYLFPTWNDVRLEANRFSFLMEDSRFYGIDGTYHYGVSFSHEAVSVYIKLRLIGNEIEIDKQEAKSYAIC